MSSDDDDARRILTRKELAKEQRQAAYQRAKEQRASDPRYQAMKQAAKEQRRAAYQRLKQSRKAEATATKAATKQRRVAEHDAEREQQRVNIQRTVQHVHDAQRPQPAEAREPKPAPADDTPRPETEDTPGDAAGIADCDAGLWKYVNWATPPKTLN